MNYVGIDIHKRYSICAAQNERGRLLGEARIEGNSTDGFVQYLQGLGSRSKVGVEACWNWSKLDDTLMLKRLPGVFLAGEMIDWEAPTGGYLLQGCFATGTRAARSALAYSTLRR